MADRTPRRLFGLKPYPLGREDLIGLLLQDVPRGAGMRIVATANVSHIVILRKDPLFREAYENAWAVAIDGMPIFFYAKLVAARVAQRIAGADLVPDLLGRLHPDRHRLFIVASDLDVATRTRALLAVGGFPQERVGIAVPAVGFEQDPVREELLLNDIRVHAPTHLLMCLGAPVSETWLYRHRRALGDMHAIACGGALDFMVGRRRRAPAWLGRLGMEWLWRLAGEPGRLFRRYFVDAWGIWLAVIADLISGGERVRIRKP